MSETNIATNRSNLVSVRMFIGKTWRLFHASWSMILISFLFVFILFIGIFSLRHTLPFPLEKLTQDLLAQENLPFFYGLFSNFGVMLWVSAAAVNFLSAALLSKDHKKMFMIFSGILSVWLALDDLLMLHEEVFPQYLKISETVFYLGYVLVILAYLLFFLKDIYAYTNYTLLGAALAAFAASILMDTFSDLVWQFAFTEDGAKFLGIVLWFVYYFDTSRKLITERMHTVTQ